MKSTFQCTFSGIVALAAAAILIGCQATLSPVDEIRIMDKFERVYVATGIPRTIPRLLYNVDSSWPIAAEASCPGWSITLHYGYAASNPDFVIDKIIPHEFGHIVSCYHRGNIDDDNGDAHDEYWRQAVIQLGGDPEYI